MIEYDRSMVSQYSKISRMKVIGKGPQYTQLRYDTPPRIKSKDIDRGYITRYFVSSSSQSSGNEIIEITKKHARTLRNSSLYRIVEIPWRIRGGIEDILPPPHMPNPPERLYTGVRTANLMAIEQASEQIPGIKFKLVDPLEFYIGT